MAPVTQEHLEAGLFLSPTPEPRSGSSPPAKPLLLLVPLLGGSPVPSPSVETTPLVSSQAQSPLLQEALPDSPLRDQPHPQVLGPFKGGGVNR